MHDRRKNIVEKIRQGGMVKIADLVKEYSVSIETIRRDLEDLEKRGILRRVYGGAVAADMYDTAPAFSRREGTNREEKKAIALKAAELVEDGDTLFIDVGTTTLEAARCLRGKSNLTIITNSTGVAFEMLRNSDCEVILLGGVLKRDELSTSGLLCESGISHFHVSKAFIGTGGISEKWGVTDQHLGETNARRLMIERSSKVIVLADFSKIGIAVTNCVCPLSSVNVLVTDWSVSPKAVAELRKAELEVIVAPHPRDGM